MIVTLADDASKPCRHPSTRPCEPADARRGQNCAQTTDRVQINNELPDTTAVTLNADLNQPTPVSGNKIPLVNFVFTVRAAVAAGVYPAVASLSGVYQLKPFADAANILIAAPTHYGYEGTVAGGVPLRVALPEDSGVVVGARDSPVFDTASYEGTLQPRCMAAADRDAGQCLLILCKGVRLSRRPWSVFDLPAWQCVMTYTCMPHPMHAFSHSSGEG